MRKCKENNQQLAQRLKKDYPELSADARLYLLGIKSNFDSGLLSEDTFVTNVECSEKLSVGELFLLYGIVVVEDTFGDVIECHINSVLLHEKDKVQTQAL